ncbi:glutamate-5-semialdehyde dehydrogenase [Cohnella ginsengisoli]|uniref:Gamma-glutamyl phosphate reductase n=1 Tax=Cohnella ginsengisoli TaxID=425004 RepID=A0A9X4QKN7_9BACL|nr:glutamate-5-semialdehyde dehydrogenase [Cohnella ginsengisoli]MDG0789620.1 glutamate-5-semialdehyde dehydrogenase [Cohnella ginsengisoli]
MSEARNKAIAAGTATAALNNLTTAQKNEALALMADALVANRDDIIAGNVIDIERGRAGGTSESLLDRLRLDDKRIEAIAQGLREVIALPDPVGETIAAFERPNGLRIEQLRVPIGVVGIIYEARPNVTVDAAGLCLKTGNAVVLRGGSAALESNKRIVAALRGSLRQSAVPEDALQLVEDASRASANEMLKLNGLLDVIIPRGGAALIRNVVENATVPVIETGAGICHTYVDATADYDMAEAIALNAKIQRPSVCNSMETLLIHADFAGKHLERLADSFRRASVELRADAAARARVSWAIEATDEDYATEYNDFILNVRVVGDLDEALAHIARFGTKHSECIVTEDQANADRFLQEVDAAAVYHNASTRFTDGFEFGFGAEIGISTQKLHARGPMGLPALTSTKYRIRGNGQTRG